MAMNNNLKLSKIDVSLCIVNWNTVHLTSQLIESIYNTVGNLSVEVFVVDNASVDGSVEYIENNYPEVIVIKNPKNVGYGKAHNQALRISRGRYKLILNSDVILLENALKNMVDFLDKNSDAGAIGPICLDKRGNIGYSYGNFPRPGLWILERLLGSLAPKFIKGPPLEAKPEINMSEKMEVDFIKGACLLIKKEVCEEIGLFDEDFFAYFEETDWCFRMKKGGIKRYLISDAKVIHITDASFGNVPDKAKKYFENSKKIYLEKHYGGSVALVFSWANEWANFRHKINKNLKKKNES